MHAYSFRDVVKHTDATRSQLIHWTDVALITPAICDTEGTGHPRRFSFRNVVEVRLAVILARFGLRVEDLGFILHQAGKMLEHLPASRNRVLLIGGDLDRPHQLWWGTRQELAEECRKPFFVGHAGILINLGDVVKRLEQSTSDRL